MPLLFARNFVYSNVKREPAWSTCLENLPGLSSVQCTDALFCCFEPKFIQGFLYLKAMFVTLISGQARNRQRVKTDRLSISASLVSYWRTRYVHYCWITINLQSTFLPKNFSQRRFEAVYGVYMCQRFYRKIKKIRQNSPNFWWIGTFFEQFPKFIFTVSENVIHPTRTFWKIFSLRQKIWRNLANFF